MNLIVVLEQNGRYNVAVLDEKLNSVVNTAVLEKEQLVGLGKQHTCYNFSVNNGEIVQDCGVFSRLSHKGTSMIVLKALSTSSGRIVGYSCMNAKTLTIGNAKREQLIEQQKRQGDLPLLQNAIIRNDTVNAYPGKTFMKQFVGVSRPGKVTQQTPVKHETSGHEQPVKKHVPDYISNPDLTQAQRRLLVEGKKSGALVEYYNDPRIQPECIDFYNSVIVDKNIAEDCKPIFENSNLNKEQAYELYRCALLGLDYSDICDENLTPAELEVKRLDKSMDLWGEVDYAEEPDAELFEKCLRMKENTYEK